MKINLIDLLQMVLLENSCRLVYAVSYRVLLFVAISVTSTGESTEHEVLFLFFLYETSNAGTLWYFLNTF